MVLAKKRKGRARNSVFEGGIVLHFMALWTHAERGLAPWMGIPGASTGLGVNSILH